MRNILFKVARVALPFAFLAACATDGDGKHVYGNPDAPGKVTDCKPGVACQ